MDINLTLVIQMLVFIGFVWFTMRFVWPPLVKAMEERQDKIAAGLSAAERGHKELELSQHRIIEELKQAKVQAAEILEAAQRRANQLIDEAKLAAKLEAQNQIKIGKEQLAREINIAKDSLRQQVAQLAILGAEKILAHKIDQQANDAFLANLVREISNVR